MRFFVLKFHVITHVKIKNQRSSRFECASTGERISIKKEDVSSYLFYNIVSLGKIAGRA